MIKKLKRAGALLLAAVMLSAPLQAAAFSDVSDTSVITAVTTLQTMGVIDGFPDGSFRPNTTLTRAQFCKMAVILLGITDVSPYKNTTVFPDVRASHWALGYVNAAVSSSITSSAGGDAESAPQTLKLISGFPDGTFRPDTSVSYAQAVTILMRMLGYTDADVGMNWPRSYISKASSAGLTAGVTLKDNEPVSRGNGAKLFYNLLFCKTFSNGKTGTEFIYSMGGKSVPNSILLNTSAEAGDGSGKKGALFTTGFVPTKTEFPASLQGRRGTLIVDEDGYALSFTPAEQTMREVTVGSAGTMTLKDKNGGNITVSGGAAVFRGGEETTYADVFMSLKAGQLVRVYYKTSGAIDYLLIDGGSASSGGVAVIRSSVKRGSNPVADAFGGAAGGAAIYKNGARVQPDELCRYDTMVYSPLTGSVLVSDNRIKGLYESGSPNILAPTEITVAGQELKMTEHAIQNMPAIKYNEAITVLLTYDGHVAEVVADSSVPSSIGLVTGLDGGSATVLTTGGWKVSGVSVGQNSAEGQLVSLSSTTKGALGLSAINYRQPGGAANLGNMTLGNAKIVPYCAMYERAGANCFLQQINAGDIPVNIVPQSKIAHVGYDDNGNINMLVFENLTGAGYQYGYLWSETVEVQDSGMSYSYTETTLRKADGTQTTFTNNNTVPSHSGGGVYGVSVKWTARGAAVDSVITCQGYSGIKAGDFDFDGGEYVKIGGVRYPIAEGVKVCFSNNNFRTVQEAVMLGESFNVYIDRPLSEGGKVRFIEGK